jgi:hypothetical protein
MSDVETLHSGYLLVFPIANAGPVLLLDSTRLPHSLPTVLDCCVFYMLTVSTDERAQTEGGVLLSIVSSRKGPTKRVAQRSRQWEFVHAAIPFRFKRAVVVQTHEVGKERDKPVCSSPRDGARGYGWSD